MELRKMSFSDTNVFSRTSESLLFTSFFMNMNDEYLPYEVRCKKREMKKRSRTGKQIFYFNKKKRMKRK